MVGQGCDLTTFNDENGNIKEADELKILKSYNQITLIPPPCPLRIDNTSEASFRVSLGDMGGLPSSK